MNSDQQKFTDAQQWLAFQYVAAELSEAEAESFEQQMLENVELCEAVIEATRLTLCVASTKSERPAPVSRVTVTTVLAEPQRTLSHSSVGRAVAMMVAACCCGLLAVFTSWIPGSNVESLVANRTDAEVLVNVWADGSFHDDASEAETTLSLDQDLDVPEWLFAAVLLPEATDGQPRNGGQEEDWY